MRRMPALMNEMLSGNFGGKLLRTMGFFSLTQTAITPLTKQMPTAWKKFPPGAVRRDLTKMASVWRSAMTGGI